MMAVLSERHKAASAARGPGSSLGMQVGLMSSDPRAHWCMTKTPLCNAHPNWVEA